VASAHCLKNVDWLAHLPYGVRGWHLGRRLQGPAGLDRFRRTGHHARHQRRV